jgi:hypothetical protein
LAGIRQLKVGARDIREIADGFAYLSSRPDLTPHERAGIVAATSYAVGPSVMFDPDGDLLERINP